jgi:hypothetical protein
MVINMWQKTRVNVFWILRFGCSSYVNGGHIVRLIVPHESGNLTSPIFLPISSTERHQTNRLIDFRLRGERPRAAVN